MNLIKISTNLELSVHEFPGGSHEEQNQFLQELIGNNCRIYEHVMPDRLYTELHMFDHPSKIPGQCVSMLIDEESRIKENKQNLIGSYLYRTEQHGCPIMGNILFVGEKWSGDGIDFCGIDDRVFELLELELKNLIYTMKTVREALRK